MNKTFSRLACAALSACLLTGFCQPVLAMSNTPSLMYEAKTKSVTLPDASWQYQVSFPDWDGYVDDTLAMNNLFSYDGYSGQGYLYVSVADGVESFRLFVNNIEIDTRDMKAGGTYYLDTSELAKNGTNTIQVSAITPTDASEAITVSIPYPEVMTSLPDTEDMDQDILDLVNSLIESEIKYGFSGAELAVIKNGKLVVNEAYGQADGYNKDGTRIEPGDDNYVPVTTDTLFDLASNTKMYSVNYALQYMLSKGGYDIALDDPITKFFPTFDDEGTTIFKDGTTDEQKAQIIEWKSQLTIRDILMHQAGFDPDPQYHNDKFNQVTQKADPDVENPLFSQDRDTTLQMVLASPLTYEPGSKTLYSDVDYMLLCFIIEQVTGQGLDEFLKETFWEPMGLEHITYNPLQNGFTKEQTAATELNGNTRDGAISFANVRTDTVWGEVHDEKAYYSMGGVSGHAGLFANAEDLAKLASVMLTGGYGENKFFSKDVMDEFTKAKSTDYPTWGLGWWRQAEVGRVNYFTTHASNSTIGHQGWTGTLTVIDPENELVIVLLTNKKNSPVLDPSVNANDFYSDNMVLGCLGSVVGYVYESFTSTPEAMDASVLQFATERMKLMSSHKGAYDEAVHMNDSFALTDLAVSWAEKRQSKTTKDNAQTLIDNLKTYVESYVDSSYSNTTYNKDNNANAEKWLDELQARVDAIAGFEDDVMCMGQAVSVDSIPGADENGNYVSGTDQNAVYFPTWGTASTAYAYNNSITWFEGFEGQGTVYFYMEQPVDSLDIYINGMKIDTSAMLNTTGAFAIDVSDLAVNGRNSVQVTGMPISQEKKSVLMTVPNMEVIDETDNPFAAEEAGIDSQVLDLIDAIVSHDVANGFPSAQMALVKDGKLIYSNAWGLLDSYNQDGTPKTDSAPVTTETLYDLASNTKMYSVNFALQHLVAQGQIALSDPITKYFENFASDVIEIDYDTSYGTGAADLETAKKWKEELTIQDILMHQAGFVPDPQFHNDNYNQATQKIDGTANVLYAIGQDNVLAAICKAPLVYEPGTKTVYSDVDYMLLGLIVQKVTGMSLEDYLKETFWEPMGLTNITYNPLDNGFTADDCAATELNGNTRDGAISFTGVRTYTLQGQVHDEKAWYSMGGVSGHAGLFANAETLATLANAMQNESGYGTNRFFNANVNSFFTSRKDALANWGMGWWREADLERPWYFGVQSSRSTIGHQGWTGTLTAIDPQENLTLAFLTNKINSPVTDNTVNPNKFNGNWYTTSTLGFVNNILYLGIKDDSAMITWDEADLQNALEALLGDMATDKIRLAAEVENLTMDHPIAKATESIVSLLEETAAASPTPENIQAAKSARESFEALLPAEETVDTSALEAVIASAEALDLSAFENTDDFEAALEQAKAVLENPESQEAVDAAVQSLTDAMDALVPVKAQKIIYRAYNPNNGDHLFTKSMNEYLNAIAHGWKDEAISWVSPESSNTPVYRVYDKNSGEHHYTSDENEVNVLVKTYGWSYEGIAWYSDDDQTTNVYRVYNPNAAGAGRHHYTTDENEYKTLVSLGWKDEKIGFYALSAK